MGYRMTAPIGCANRAVGTMLAMRKPIDEMLHVADQQGNGEGEQGRMNARREVAFAGQKHQDQRCRGEHQLDQHVSGKDRLRAQRRGAKPFENAALAIDGDDRDQGKYRAEGDQNRHENRYSPRGKNCLRLARAA